MDSIKNLPADQKKDIEKFLSTTSPEKKKTADDDIYAEFVHQFTKKSAEKASQNEEEEISEESIRAAALKERRLAKQLARKEKDESERKLMNAPADDYEAYGKREQIARAKAGTSKIEENAITKINQLDKLKEQHL